MNHNDFDPTKLTQVHRVVGAVVGFAFAAIGVVVFGWLWLQPFGFMNPPIFFRLIGSLIAIMFVAIGSTMGVTALKGGSALQEMLRRRGRLSGHQRLVDQSRGGYKCPNCGAALAEHAEVSPSGDVKCDYCRTWFNIHA
jgi:hypothetical protein